MSRSLGIARSANSVDLSSKGHTAVQDRNSVSQEVHTKVMSKYWKKSMSGNYSVTFKHWQTDMSLAPKDQTFMGRQTGTNKSFAVRWNNEANSFIRGDRGMAVEPVSICQWITFADFGNIRQCVWRGTDV